MRDSVRRGQTAKRLPNSTLEYVLEGLLPYTEANIKLTFKPGLFFDDLEKISRAGRRTIRNAYYRAQRAGLVELDGQGIPRLTDKGQRRARPFVAQRLSRQARLMVIFDIPEEEAWKRKRLRAVLRELRFEPIQKSVWISQYDHRKLIAAEVKQYGLDKYVQIYEASKL